MENEFKKKMQNIAMFKLQKVKEETDPKQLLKERKEREDNCKKAFNQLKQNTIIPMIKELNEIFKDTGDTFLVFSNDRATVLKDQIRTFSQVFYYQKGRSQNKVGLNTSSLLFECLPFKEEVQISSNTELRSSPLKKLATISLKDFNAEIIERAVSTFVSAVTN